MRKRFNYSLKIAEWMIFQLSETHVLCTGSWDCQGGNIASCCRQRNVWRGVVSTLKRSVFGHTMRVLPWCYEKWRWLMLVHWNFKFLLISIGNSMIYSDIWHKYHEWYFEIVIRNFTSRYRRMKFEIILKYHEGNLRLISRTNHAIICLYYYPQNVCNFHM